ncbi:MAG: 2-dehydropantoate 2-reductase [Anaerolineales bacterium]|nr:2-dehydropantoate 2-reductase [Anaerolineales bacterium]MDW8277634.1 2-dehydropantoate 2-reductase [Anaerolineales bacterium]
MTRILLLGTGALATLFAARLGAAGHSVTLLGTWREALHALNRDGARLILADGSELRVPVCAVDTPAACTPVELALVLVKAWQTGRAAQHLAGCLTSTGVALTFQNGWGNDAILAESLGTARVLLGICTYGATSLAPGLARVGGEGVLALQTHPRSEEIAVLLRAAGFQAQIVSDAASLVWGKLVVNSAINPLTALLRVPNGKLLEYPAARSLLRALAQETAQVAQAQGVTLPFADSAAAVEEVARRTADNRSSMLQDVERGAPTEIEAICGAVVRAAQAQGMAAPLNWTMWQLVKAQVESFAFSW